MSENMTPWLILAAAGSVILFLKGYVHLPSMAALSTKPASVSNIVRAEASPSEAFSLERMDSRTLGVYFALAKRREAEEEVAHAIAEKAGKDIKEAFTAPFSVAAPPADASQ